MRDCGEDQHVLDLFTKGSHDNDVTCIYLTQNLFPPGKYARTISLNTHYVVALKNPRDALGVRNLAQQAYPGRVPYVMACFQDATSQPYGYLLFDPHPSTPDILRLRTNLLTQPTIVYQEDTRCQQQHRMTMMILERSWLTVPPQPPWPEVLATCHPLFDYPHRVHLCPLWRPHRLT